MTYSIGATPMTGNRCRFDVWAPEKKRLDVCLLAPIQKVIPMTGFSLGYFRAILDGVEPGALYKFRVDGMELPDPASRSQPEGVHGPSEVIHRDFEWTDDSWFGLPLRDFVLYEMHVGTFTREGTFEAVIPLLKMLRDLGVTAIEIMPVAQFSGERNWGYDGVYPFAVQNSYGGPTGLKKLVNAAHQLGLAVVLDVVYNHLGPEGNYFARFAPYFTDRYRTPWGAAINFDGPFSDEVRRYFTENALSWQTEFHLDALRLDAVHAIFDRSAVTFLEDLSETTSRRSEELNRRFHLIAESDANDARVILPRTIGGYGIDAQWSDDFHHALHVLLTGEKHGYYADYGGTEFLAQVLRDGYAYVNKYSPHRGRRHGNSPRLARAKQFVVCSRNHDQIGNRADGQRMSRLISFESMKLAAATVALSPFVPMLFMGEEYGEEAPFQYFTSHSDYGLAEAVRQGRRAEFAAFHNVAEVPDPQDPTTFQRSKLNHQLRVQGKHRVISEFYQELLTLRRALPPIRLAERETMHVIDMPHEQTVCIHYWSEDNDVFVILCFAQNAAKLDLPLPSGRWQKRLDSTDDRWSGPGTTLPHVLDSNGRFEATVAGRSCVLLHQEFEEN